MTMISFDALKLARNLRAAGMPSEQAEAVAEAEAEALGEFVQSHLATKRDIAELKQATSDCKSELKLEITAVRSELKEDIANVRQEIANVRQEIASVRVELHSFKTEIIKWNIGTTVTLVAIMLAVLRLTG